MADEDPEAAAMVKEVTLDLRTVARRRTVRLTTRGRKTGQPRTVKIWFVVSGPDRLSVQHVAATPAHWYRNLLREAAVSVDFGDGPVPAAAEPIRDAERIRDVLRKVRRKYPLAWIIQFVNRKAQPVAAQIVLKEPGSPR
jgi:deazaflavin-dependent oxidoreductase (nitroreductase family)